MKNDQGHARIEMEKKIADDKKTSSGENEIREGQENNSIADEKNKAGDKEYPALSKEDSQFKTQEEFNSTKAVKSTDSN